LGGAKEGDSGPIRLYMRKLFIVGFPGLYGGAGTELYHQIKLWVKSFPEIKLTIIPTMQGYENEPLYKEMVSLGLSIGKCMDFSEVTADDAVINFCSKIYLDNIGEIAKKTKRTMWVNCMTFLFDTEKKDAGKNNINFYLYQREGVREFHEGELKKLGCKGNFITFKPYFDPDGYEFSILDQQFVNIGRISRRDADKFAKATFHIYEYITAPKLKRARFLGYDETLQKKLGNRPSWITGYRDHSEFSVKDFYKATDFIVQPTETNENWPRIGFEAMFSGKPLVVDDRGGWKHMIEHGKSGFLCKNEREFIYWGTRLAFELDLRTEIAYNALERAKSLSSLEESTESWKQVFEKVYE
jgi:glycosyltransferase involved in cell wall biosynthesis